MPTYRTPEEIAAKVGLSVQTVRSHLREKYRKRDPETWYRLSDAEFAQSVAELEAGKALLPGKPRRGLHRIQRFWRQKRAMEAAGQSVLFG